MLIAEDLLLLLTDDTSGRLAAPAARVDIGLAGANLLELTLMNKVDLSREGDEGRAGRIVVRDPAPTGDEVLDAALEIIAARQGKKPTAVLEPLSKHVRRTLYERLTGRGVLRAEEGKILGVFPSHRWPAQDAHHEAEVRQRLTQALVEQTPPDARSAALIALAHALECDDKVIDRRAHELSRHELRSRAERIARGNWASAAVRTAIDEMTAAVVAATTTSSSFVVLSGGSHAS